MTINRIKYNRKISRLLKANENLRKSETICRKVVEEVNDIVYTLDDKGYFTYISHACVKMAGYEPNEIVGKHFLELIVPEWKERVEGFYLNKFENRNETLYSFPIITKSGEQKWTEQISLQLREGDKITGHRFIMRDITGRKATEDLLEKSNKKFFQIFNFCPVAICITTIEDGRFIYANDEFYNTTGYKSEEIIEKKSVDIKMIEAEERDKVIQQIQKTGEHIKPIEIKIRKANGNMLDVFYSVERIEWDNKICFLTALVDITERKRKEEIIKQKSEELEKNINLLEIANKELNSFSYSVAHDLKAPLRAINGFSVLLKKSSESKLDDAGKELLNTVIENSTKMSRLIEDLLEFSKMKKREFTDIDIDMEKIVKEVYDELIKNEAGRIIDFKINPLPHIKGDYIMIKQIWTNLISNALKYTQHKEKTEISISSQSTETENVYFIKDNGAGFDMAYSNKLFGVFQRLHSANEFEGNGIGLAIIKRIVDRYQGRVWAEGKVNEGATFYFTLKK